MRRLPVALAALVLVTAGSAQQMAAPMLPHGGVTNATPFRAAGDASSASAKQRAGHSPDVIDDFGAYGDGWIVGATATIAAGSSSLAVASPLFSAHDVGKVIGISGAGVTQSFGSIVSIPLTTQGASCSSSTPPSIALGGGAYASAVFVYSVTAATVASGGSGTPIERRRSCSRLREEHPLNFR